MENFKSHKREIFWYITHVPRERSGMFFDIGGWHHAPAIGPKPVWADGKTPARSPSASSRGAAETHPTPAACTQHQRIGFRGKAANFTQRKTEYDGASRGNHAAYPLFLFFVKVLSGTCHETGFRGCAAFLFRAKAAVSSVRRGKETNQWTSNARIAEQSMK